MRQFYADEMEMTYESNGMPPIAQMIVARYYIPAGNVTLYKAGVWRQYELNSLIQHLKELGKELYKDDTVVKKAVTDFRAYGAELEHTCDRIVTSPKPQREDFRQLIAEGGRYMHEYQWLDAWYTDGAYPFRDDRKVAAALEYAEEEKNVMREEFGAMFFEKGKLFLGALSHIGESLGIEAEDSSWYFTEEIEAAFDGTIRTPEQTAARRRAYVHLVDTDGALSYIDGDEAERYIRTFESRNQASNVTELTGQTANRGAGIVRGTVRVINSDYLDFSTTQAAMDAMQEGDVLVSPTTAPDLLPAMKKASAIITDIGGMLSHAALTSRELNKLCIVATRIASRVFKDGDMVEVDAEKATIRKI